MLIDNIKMHMDNRGFSQYKLAKTAGIPHSTMSTLLKGGIKNPSVDMINKIAVALNVPISELIENEITIEQEKHGMSFYGGPEEYTQDEVEVMEAALRAYREQKQKLLDQINAPRKSDK